MAKSVTVDFNANLTKFEKGITKATQKLDKFSGNAKRQSGIMGNAFNKLGGKISGAFIGLAGITGLTLLTKRSLDFADSISKASEKTRFSVKRIQELRFAAGQTGIAMSVLDGALGRFTKRLGLAREGSGAAAATYKRLGTDLSQTNEQVFKEVVQTLGDMDNATNRLALTTRLFGDDAQQLGVLFAKGNEGLKVFADQAHRLGLVLSKDMTDNAAAANDQLTIMSKITSMQATRALVSLAPTITFVGQAFSEASVSVGIFIDSMKDIEDRVNLTGLKEELSEAKERLYELIQAEAGADGGGFIDRFKKGQGYFDRKIQKSIKTISELRARIEEVKGPDITPRGTKEVDNAIGSIAKLKKETEKLFAKKAFTPFKDTATDAAKISKTYRLINEALSDGGGAESVGKAAAAINKLNEGGIVAEQTIKDMKVAMSEIMSKEGVADVKAEIKVLATIEDAQAKAHIEALTQPGEKVIYVTYIERNKPGSGSDNSGSSDAQQEAQATGGRQ